MVRKYREVILAPVGNRGGIGKAGGTLTGDLVLPADPDQPLEAATKQYVDKYIPFGDTNVGDWYTLWPHSTVATTTFPADSLRLARTYLPTSIDYLQAEVQAGASPSVLKLVVYNDNNGTPTTLAAATGNLSGTAASAISGSITTVPAGFHWIGVLNVGAGTPTMRTGSGANPWSTGVNGTPPTGTSLSGSGWTWAGNPSGTLPAPTAKNSSAPVVYVRVAA